MLSVIEPFVQPVPTTASEHLDYYQALQDSQFVPFFQPLVALRTGQVKGFEVLARLQHPVEGLIPPSRFIALAEREGWIDQLTWQVLRKAFKVGSEVLADPLTLAVNISPLLLWDLTLADHIYELAREAAFPMSRIVVEITESALIDNLENAAANAAKLRKFGIQLALDDFGTGYSSLLHLQALPFSEIKIDRSFVSSMTESRESRKIVSAVVGLGQTLGHTTVGEGIETQEQAEMLLWLGCDIGQGYFYGRPLPAKDIATYMSETRSELQISTNSKWTSLSTGILDMSPTADTMALQIFDAMVNGVSIGDATLPGVPLIYVNPAFERMTGYSKEEIIGQSCSFLQGVDRDQPGIRKIRDAIRQSTPERTLLRNYRKDGTLFYNELSLSPIFNPAGNLTHFVGVQHDLTTETQAKILLADEHERLLAATERSMDCLYICSAVRDESGEITDFVFDFVNDNASKMVSIPMARLIGGRMCELIPANRFSGLFDRYKRVVITGEPLVHEFAVDDENVQSAMIRIRAVKLKDGIVINASDISVRKRGGTQS